MARAARLPEKKQLSFLSNPSSLPALPRPLRIRIVTDKSSPSIDKGVNGSDLFRQPFDLVKKRKNFSLEGDGDAYSLTPSPRIPLRASSTFFTSKAK